LRPWNLRNSPPLEAGELQRIVASALVNGTARTEKVVSANGNGLSSLIISKKATQQPGEPDPWEVDVLHMDQVEPLDPRWFWEGYFPAGALSILDGDPGVGKSQLSIDLAARYTRGDSMPPLRMKSNQNEPGTVIMLSAEDDPAFTIRPRLDAAGADPSRVKVIRTLHYSEGDAEREIEFPLDVDRLHRAIVKYGAGLLIIDPISAHFGEAVNTNSDASVRSALRPLARMAEDTGCAVLLVRHLNKKSGQSALHRGGGSIGIIGACRAGFVVAHDPGQKGQIVLAATKMNLAVLPKSLVYTIEPSGTTSRVKWGGHSDCTADDLLASPVSKNSPKLERAKEIIQDILSVGTRGENEVRQACFEEKISQRTYKRARTELGVTSEKSAFDGQWILQLPTEEEGDQE
jgi:RecA-family ATPase